MKLYNTLSKQVEKVTPLHPDGTLTMYSCGPTVYDHIHIGNLSSFIFADMLRRTLQAEGLEVQHAMNFTDVDDKTIRRSRERYPDIEPLAALLKLTEEYADIFISDMVAVGNDAGALVFIKATDSIEPMQQLIRQLYARDFAYIADDGVYFSIEAYLKSGKKYGQLTAVTTNSTSQARIQNDEYDKESAHDFALWKSQKGNEPAWEFELDGHNLTGRPGWHIECSAMSRLLLGQPFDIHTGGVDLMFPHHENEIAQSTAGSDDVYARLFAHNEHLLVDGQKMSKSLNNFHTLEAIEAKGFQPLAFRLLVLQAHYRKQAHFSWENLEAAQNRLQAYRAMADLYWQSTVGSGVDMSTLGQHQESIAAALRDDLDTPAALAELSALEAAIDRQGISTASQGRYGELLTWLDEQLGLQLKAEDISEAQKGLIEQRQQARDAQDWARSDQLRDELQQQGINLRDTEHGSLWSRA